MSKELVWWAARQKCGDPAAAAVLKALCIISRDDTGPVAWPSIDTIADGAECDPKTVRAALKRLVARRLIADSGRRHGRGAQVIEWLIGPDRVPELGGLGDHAAAACPTETGTPKTRSPTAFSAMPYQNREAILLESSEERARADAGQRARDLPPGRSQKKEMLGEGSGGGVPATSSADPPDGNPLDVIGSAWNAMEAHHGLPLTQVREPARDLAVQAKLDAVGLTACIAIVATVGLSDLVAGRRAQRHRGQSDWEVMFDQVFAVGPRFAGSALFARLLAAPGSLLAGIPLEAFDELAEAERALAAIGIGDPVDAVAER